jgi:5-methyltetrahydropteroyltriglutamate--homocysteine methyltransferase
LNPPFRAEHVGSLLRPKPLVDARAAGAGRRFEPLRFVPKDRCVVLGLVSTKTPVLEPKDEWKRRIDAASRHFPPERLGISPQCGFASHPRGSALAFADQEAKLRRVVETAAEFWADR